MMTDQQRTIILPDSDMADSSPSLLQNRRPQFHNISNHQTIDGHHQQARIRSQSAKLGNKRITIDNSDMYNSADFATSVFTELPEDLQEIISPSLGGEYKRIGCDCINVVCVL